mmetsp:Transcript_11642/g.19128  ORF Transcript_11642/g.19128 Transcript_11642/m.19128 type:complete len:250 (+) Transcript_11642:271-1020(+)
MNASNRRDVGGTFNSVLLSQLSNRRHRFRHEHTCIVVRNFHQTAVLQSTQSGFEGVHGQSLSTRLYFLIGKAVRFYQTHELGNGDLLLRLWEKAAHDDRPFQVLTVEKSHIIEYFTRFGQFLGPRKMWHRWRHAFQTPSCIQQIRGRGHARGDSSLSRSLPCSLFGSCFRSSSCLGRRRRCRCAGLLAIGGFRVLCLHHLRHGCILVGAAPPVTHPSCRGRGVYVLFIDPAACRRRHSSRSRRHWLVCI